MSAFDLLLVVIPVLDSFPRWGPVLAVVTAVLLWRAAWPTGRRRADTSADLSEDTAPGLSSEVCPTVRTMEDSVPDALTLGAVTCPDTVPGVSTDGVRGVCPDDEAAGR